MENRQSSRRSPRPPIANDRERRLVIVGPGRVGKTTLLRQIQALASDSTVPETLPEPMASHGFTFERFTHKSNPWIAWELAAQRGLRSRWSSFLDGADGVIFVVDASDADLVDYARPILHSVPSSTATHCESPPSIANPRSPSTTFLVFVNCQDKPGAMSIEEIRERLGCDDRVPFIGGSARAGGDGVREAITWILGDGQ